MIDNFFIAEQFSLLSKLMDIHAENSFKAKSYAAAAFNIEKLPVQLADTAPEKFSSLKGVGDSVAKKVSEILETGKLQALEDIIMKTPPGVIEMLNIKGIGPKKISTIWKEMEIESIGELLYACNENRLLLYKGFGEKTQKNVTEAIEFYQMNQGSHLYAEIETYTENIDKKLPQLFPSHKFAITGEYKRQLEIIDKLEWVTTASQQTMIALLQPNGFAIVAQEEKSTSFKAPQGVVLQFYHATKETFYKKCIETSCGGELLSSLQASSKWATASGDSEEAVFDSASLPVIPAYLREFSSVLNRKNDTQVIETQDIKGIIHNHSNWSDGLNTIEDMAKACIAQGFEYFVISDHSKSAFYANGLQEERIREQHRYIDELNEKLKPFRIFKSIECDILNDGSLDYSNEILATFDLVITSVHSNLKMTEEKAMSRLLTAIQNPYTTILGHPTGRLLLSRKGYPVDHEKLIDACAANDVVIELNAHPRRLDLDWRWIDNAAAKNVLISIDPDAHAIEGFNDIQYGVKVAQKAGITAKQNLSCFSLVEFENFLSERRKKKGLG